MRDQAAINEKIRHRALERKANGTLKVPTPFSKGFDPRRKLFSSEDRERATVARNQMYEERWSAVKIAILAGEQVKDGNLKRYLLETVGTCQGCGIGEWRGKKLSLELHHKDGEDQNNTLANAELLCPNCHSLTDTWKVRKDSRRCDEMVDFQR